MEESLSKFSLSHTHPSGLALGREDCAGHSAVHQRAHSVPPGNRWQCGNSPAVHHWPTPSSLPGISEHQDANPSLQFSSHGAHSRSIIYPPLTDPLVQRSKPFCDLPPCLSPLLLGLTFGISFRGGSNPPGIKTQYISVGLRHLADVAV